MKKFISIFFIIIFSNVFADEPPDWSTNFKKYSKNKLYYAEVSPLKPEQSGNPWDWKYRLELKSVLSKGNNKIVWSTEYFHSGYSQIMVSNDGKYVVYVEYWFYPEGALVRTYSENSIQEWNAKKLTISKTGLPKTESHHLWLSSSSIFVQNSKDTTIGLRLFTKQGVREIDFNLGASLQ